MVTKKKAPAKRRPTRANATEAAEPKAEAAIPAATSPIPEMVREFLKTTSIPKGFVNPKEIALADLRKRVTEDNLRPTVPLERLLASVNRIKPAALPIAKLPEDIKESIPALKPGIRRFHGVKIPLYWFPLPWVSSTCADRFGYMSSAATRAATKLPFNVTTQDLLGQLGNMMGDAGRDPNPASHNPADAGVSSIPAGFTYFGQCVDHDITFDVSSTLDADTDANTINNMRSPSLDLDSVYGRGPGLDPYWVNFNFPTATLGQVFEFNRNPRLPVFSNWVVDFNAFFDTGVPVPVHNKARKIDSFIASGLEALPGFAGMMAILTTRNLRRALALGLPSGQGMANSFGIAPMTAAQLTSGLPADEVAVLNSSGGLLLNRTPLWYYVLREAAVLGGGNQLGPVGGRIVAETFVRMLKRDASSYLNVSGGFTPILPSAVPGNFTVADLVTFAGVTQP